ncbi:hypothetical protein E2C01_071132 [Portunus trituberculatus]|uniref:Uncharacterized protein n=1 Tax=Portunus trituberculatus TaxID=210409 RepID=A0A5B7I5F5_PORTR|nr:hypothetical protein [Portunus trituberculatus]
MGGRGVAVAVAVVVAACAVGAGSVGGWRAEAGWAGNDTRLLESHAHTTPPSLRQNPPITPLDPDSHALKVLTIPRQDRYTQGSHGAGGGAPSKTPPREAEEWGLGRGRGRWQGRRVVPDYETLEEEVLQGVDSGDPHAMLPDPTGAAVAVLARRLHHAAIRHRNGRRHFIRTRKAPKTRPRAGGEALQITWQHSALRHQEEEEWGEEEGEEEDGGEEQLHEESEIIEATSSSLPWSSGAPNLENKFRAMGDLVPTGLAGMEEGGEGGAGEQDAWGGQEEADVDVVTKFLRIVESQHLLGENCTKGTDFHLGEGVVDRYAQERFRLEGEIAVNRANLYTRLWKYSPSQVLASEYLLHAEVLTMVELDEDIFAAGNCYDKFEYEDYLLYCPFAYRLPEGNILVKDLAVEYKYLSNTSEWFFIARKNAERAINNYTHITKGKAVSE